MNDFAYHVVITRADGVVAHEVDGGLSITHPTSGLVHDLRGVGRLIWDTLDEPRTVLELIEVIATHHPSVDHTVIRQDLQNFLDELRQAELITA